MKVLCFLVAIGAVVVVVRKKQIATMPAKPTSFAPAQFQSVPELGPAVNDPITEAAYHQGATDFTAAFGDDANTGGTEVLLLQ